MTPTITNGTPNDKILPILNNDKMLLSIINIMSEYYVTAYPIQEKCEIFFALPIHDQLPLPDESKLKFPHTTSR